MNGKYKDILYHDLVPHLMGHEVHDRRANENANELQSLMKSLSIP